MLVIISSSTLSWAVMSLTEQAGKDLGAEHFYRAADFRCFRGVITTASLCTTADTVLLPVLL